MIGLTLETQGSNVIGSYVIHQRSTPMGPSNNGDVLNRFILGQKQQEVGLLPPVVRYISPDRTQVVLERPPQTINVNYYGVKLSHIARAKLQTYTICLPWTVYAIRMNSVGKPMDIYVFASTGPMESENHPLYLLPIPNSEKGGRFCVPYHPEWYDQEPVWTLSQSINAAYSQIWASNFNNDLNLAVQKSYRTRKPTPIFEESGKKPISRNARANPASLFSRWSQFSMEDVLRFDWPEIQDNYTVGRLIKVLNYNQNKDDFRYLYNDIRQKVM